MKILRSTLAIILLLNFFMSCTADDVAEEQETYTMENIQAKAKGDKFKKVKKETEKE